MDITSEEDFQLKVMQSTVPVAIDFWAEWCGPCKMVDPVLTQLSLEYKDKVLFVKVNIDDLPDIATKYGIQSIPTLVIVQVGTEKNRIVGAHPKAHYVQELNKLV